MLNSSATRKSAIQRAQAVLDRNPVYLDTETTGLGTNDEIIEISIIDNAGQVAFESLVRPSQPIPTDATSIHGIRDADVQGARPWPIVWQQVRQVLSGRLVVIYNQEFDIRLMKQSHARYRMPWTAQIDAFDLLKLYAEFRGEWDPQRRGYRYHSLENAGRHSGISLPNTHRATDDTLLTRALLQYIAACQ